MEYYAVNPTNTADIRGNPSENNRPYRDRDEYVDPWGPGRIRISRAREDLNLYAYNAPSNEAPPPGNSPDLPNAPYYNAGAISLALVGPVQTAGSTVDGTQEWIQLTLDELLEAKRDELRTYTTRVRESAFEHDAGGLEFWARGGVEEDSTRATYNGYLSTRIADQLTRAVQAGIDAGGGTNAEVAAFWGDLKTIVLNGTGSDQLYWSRDIKVELYDRVTLQEVRDAANQAQWSQLIESAGTFHWQFRNANNRVEADFRTAYTDNDWTQLATIVVSDPVYNWPPFFDGSFAPGAISIQQMRNR